MKMKYLYRISAFLLGTVMMFGCVEWEEFQPVEVASAPTVTVAQSNVGDSTISVEVTSSAAGYVAAILLEGTGNPVPADSTALLEGNVNYLDYAYSEVEANAAATFTFSSDIVQNSPYEVMAVAANTDGVVSAVEVISITTDDTFAPNWLSSSPTTGYDPVVGKTDTLILEFDEPVMVGDGSFTFETFFEGQVEVVPAENILVSGNLVGVIISFTPAYGDYLWLHWEEGALKDLAGNNVEALTTVYDPDSEIGPFIGAYWRIVQTEMDYSSISPNQAEEQDPGFEIVISYDSAVSFVTSLGSPVIGDGDITITYDDGAGSTLIIGVAVADITLDGKNVIIAQTKAPIWYGTATLDIPEGLMTVGHGNPMVPVSESWNTVGEHPLALVLGSYLESDYDDTETLEATYDVTIGPNPDDDTKVIINNFWGGGESISATVDLDAMTLTIGSDEVIYVSADYGNCTMTLMNDAFDAYVDGDIVCTIEENGNWTTPKWAATVSAGAFGVYSYTTMEKQ